MRPTRSRSRNSSPSGCRFRAFRPWSKPPWRRRTGRGPCASPQASRTRSQLTISQDRWPGTSCPKLPQRRCRDSAGPRARGSRDEDSMQFLATIGGWSGWATGYYLVVPFLFVLTIVVFFHELGHFLVARWCGIRVQVFSIGFGRELLGFSDRHGTRWKLAAIPLGGYVKFFGDDNAASVPDAAAVAAMTPAERQQSFFHKSVTQRAAVVVAGPIANFLLAIAIFAGVFALYGKQVTSPRVD